MHDTASATTQHCQFFSAHSGLKHRLSSTH